MGWLVLAQTRAAYPGVEIVGEFETEQEAEHGAQACFDVGGGVFKLPEVLGVYICQGRKVERD
jgi:hypothetical protein